MVFADALPSFVHHDDVDTNHGHALDVYDHMGDLSLCRQPSARLERDRRTTLEHRMTSVAVGSVTDSTSASSVDHTRRRRRWARTTCTITAQFKPSALGAQGAARDQRQREGAALFSGRLEDNWGLRDHGDHQRAIPWVATPGEGADLDPWPASCFATTLWTADPSGQLTVTSSHDSPGTFENWFVDVATGLSSNHVISVVQ
jgi:hypothetical protein